MLIDDQLMAKPLEFCLQFLLNIELGRWEDGVLVLESAFLSGPNGH